MSQIVRNSFDMHGLSLGLCVANVSFTFATPSPKLKPCMSKLIRTICDIDETSPSSPQRYLDHLLKPHYLKQGVRCPSNTRSPLTKAPLLKARSSVSHRTQAIREVHLLKPHYLKQGVRCPTVRKSVTNMQLTRRHGGSSCTCMVCLYACMSHMAARQTKTDVRIFPGRT